MPIRSLAGKLQLTRLALGCSTQKELVARFAAVNPSTAFTSQNAYKWLGGKAMPRVSSVYEDWSQILGGRLAAPFIAACSFEEFVLALREHFDIPEGAIRALHLDTAGGVTGEVPAPSPAARLEETGTGRAARWAGPGRSDLSRGTLLLEGTYLVVSPAWSRPQRGRIVVGAARIGAQDAGGISIDYRERVLGRIVPFSGPVFADSQTVQSVIECLPTGRYYFLTLQAPVFPANLIGGLLCGTALHDPDSRSVASRILLLRNHVLDWEGLVARSGYLDMDAAMFAGELTRLGYVGDVDEVATRITGFFQPRMVDAIDVGAPEFGALGHVLDLLDIQPR